MHNDLHSDNVFVKFVDGSLYGKKGSKKPLRDHKYFDYRVRRTPGEGGYSHFRIPNLGFIVKLGDMGGWVFCLWMGRDMGDMDRWGVRGASLHDAFNYALSLSASFPRPVYPPGTVRNGGGGHQPVPTSVRRPPASERDPLQRLEHCSW